MRRTRWAGAVAVVGGLGILAACGGSDDGPDPLLACADISGDALGMGNLRVTTRESVAGVTGTPAHCRVRGYLDERTGTDGKPYGIGFEARLPTDWNGRFYFQGGGGTDGAIQPAMGSLPGAGNTTTALAKGYAVFSTDGGHTSEAAPVVGGALFGLDPQARIDYGYNAVGQVTRMGKTLIDRVYGRAPEHSYFVGCSNGGRQAQVAAGRFAAEFDGVIAGNPGTHLPQAGVQHAWDVQALASVAPRDAAGAPILSQAFTQADMQLVADAVVGACDALDGAVDGMIHNAPACRTTFDPASLTCAPGQTASCLQPAQVTALTRIFAGPSNSAGQALYADWPFDAGVATMGWRVWKLGTSPTAAANSLIATLGGGALPYIFMTPPTAVTAENNGVLQYLLGYDFDRDAPGIFATTSTYRESSMQFMSPPSAEGFEAFKAKGGKMIVYHGDSDPVFSVNDSIRWYEGLQRRHGMATAQFARLFTIPGMNHCSGGPATDQFPMLDALVAWVEEGKAPDRVIATARADNPDAAAWAGRTRPLCPYPQQVRYRGTGSLEDAASFACVTP